MILLILAVLPLVNSQGWNYGSLGPVTWADNFPQCGEANQSPVNIDIGAAEYDSSLNAFGFRNFDKKANNELENTGTTARMLLGENKGVFLYNGGLDGRYITEGFHFRWGSDHTINGRQFPLELHIGSYSAKFGTFMEAIGASATEPDSVMAMAVLFEISPNDNVALEPIVNALGQIQTAGSKAKITGSLRFEDLLPFSAATNYYRYQGRFSNPPCFNTLWTVFADTVLISERQLEAFKGLNDMDGNPLKDVFRPTQDLGDRIVKSSVPPQMEFVPGSPPRKACVDVFFVIDESCSVYEDMQKVKDFIKDLVDGIIVGDDAVLMSLVRYSAPVNMNFFHSMTTSNDVVKGFIDTQPLGQQSTCRTHTSQALKFNSNRFFGLGKWDNETAERDFGIRNIAPDVMIIITDGTSIPMKGRPSALAEAAKLRARGVEIYTIGLINQNERDGSVELRGFTGGNDDHVFDINDEGLAGQFADIINSYKTCTGDKDCSQLDMVLVIDTSQSLLKSTEWERIRKDPDNHHEIKSVNLMAVKTFFKQLLAAVPIGMDKTRVAIVSFDEVVTIHQYLDETTDYAGTKDTLTNSVIDYTGVGTRTDAALQYVLNRVLKGDRGDREDVNNFIMMATDGVAFPCCTAGCCMSSTGNNTCPRTDYPCISKSEAIKDVKLAAHELKENWRNDVYILALPNKPDREDNSAKKQMQKRIAMSLYEALVRNTATDIKTLEQFNELENIVKEMINRVCAAADGLFLSAPVP
ncbi:unnamed protein product [Owenia fusiformis]|uniref:Uncharacterized protein n=1 Tax=Owenia fusiformis TaxID=6347 RepID=A0A8J1YAF6_OWEFU|nr:unnamed protein product [Owenia fusiformis]